MNTKNPLGSTFNIGFGGIYFATNNENSQAEIQLNYSQTLGVQRADYSSKGAPQQCLLRLVSQTKGTIFRSDNINQENTFVKTYSRN